MKAKWILVMLVWILVMLVCCAGCMSEQQTPTVGEKIETLNEKVDEYQRIAVELVDRAEADGLVTADTAKRVDKLNEDIDELQPVIVEAVEGWQSNEPIIDKLVATNEASKPLNPYYLPIALVLEAAILVKRDLDARKNKKDAKTADSKYQAHKAASELVKLKHPEIAAEHYEEVGKARARNGIS